MKHGDGKIWYENTANYAQDLLSDLNRRTYISGFFESTIREGFQTLGRLETIYRKKGRLPDNLKKAMIERAKTEHFGQVLPMEDIRSLVMKAEAIVRMPCACRWTTGKKEVRCCYGISFGPDPWYKGMDMAYFGPPPDGGLESLSRNEALLQMESLEEYGAIHTIWTLMTPFIGSICNCLPVDCLGLRTMSRIGVETLARAEYVASINEAACTGCGLCSEQCQFYAIETKRPDGRQISVIDPNACFGCGLCRKACPEEAISLIPRA